MPTRDIVSLPSRGLYFSAALLVLALAPIHCAQGYTYQILHRFCSWANCADGAYPSATLILDRAGNLYGTTQQGGESLNVYASGTAFELTPRAGQTWQYVNLRRFCHFKSCPLGGFPSDGGPLAYAGAGSGAPYDGVSPLYGTTAIYGGSPCQDSACGGGVVYALSPTPSPPPRTFTVPYEFPMSSSPGFGGDQDSALLVDPSGNLFGTRNEVADVVYELAPPTLPGGNWKESTLYTFCAKASCADGHWPMSGLIEDAGGNLYGTTAFGGTGAVVDDGINGGGTVFELSPPTAPGGKWAERVLYDFCLQPSCRDGEAPVSALVMDGAGNLYGTTEGGGGGDGVAFELSPPAIPGGGWTEATLYAFCSKAGCADGQNSRGALIMDGAGNLYGTTEQGGAARQAGVVFELSPPAAPGGKWSETALYTFCTAYRTKPICLDGEAPLGSIVMDAAGNLYGTTTIGGTQNDGVAFELVK